MDIAFLRYQRLNGLVVSLIIRFVLNEHGEMPIKLDRRVEVVEEGCFLCLPVFGVEVRWDVVRSEGRRSLA